MCAEPHPAGNVCGYCAGTDRLPRRGVHCHDCHQTWTGTKRAHCLICHQTFSSPFTADRHAGPTRGATHRHPSTVPGLALHGDGVWHRVSPLTTPPHWRYNGSQS
jgi:hypothetical protein